MDDLKKILIRIAENDDQKAFKAFFQHYYVRLVKLALLYVPMQDQAEDIISEVLIKLLKQRKKLFRIENFEGYLFFAIKNQSISYIRKQKVQYNEKSAKKSPHNTPISKLDRQLAVFEQWKLTVIR